MKKLALATAIAASSTQASAALYDLTYAGLDEPFEPPIQTPPSHIELDEYSASMDLSGSPSNRFAVSLARTSESPYSLSTGTYNFSYNADWIYYASVGFLVAYNVECISLDSYDFCGTYLFGGLENEGGFVAVTALDNQSQALLSSPPTAAFDLRWTVAHSTGQWDWKFTFSPTPVPIPAAAWLFGSALISLIGLKRRR